MPADTRTVATAFGINAGVATICLTAFSILRIYKYTNRFFTPRRYSDAIPIKPKPLPKALLLWIYPLWRYREADIVLTAGLDTAMYLRIFSMGARIFWLLSIWCLAVVLPTNIKGKEVDRLMATQGEKVGPVAKEDAGIQLGPGSQEELVQQVTQNRYVFSDFDRLSMANISAGSPLMWVHLASVLVVTAIVLWNLWLHCQHAVALRVLYLTQAPRGGPSHTVLVSDIPGIQTNTRLERAQKVLDTSVLRWLPRRLRAWLGRGAERMYGVTAQGVEAAATLANKYLDQIEQLLPQGTSPTSSPLHTPQASEQITHAIAAQPRSINHSKLPNQHLQQPSAQTGIRDGLESSTQPSYSPMVAAPSSSTTQASFPPNQQQMQSGIQSTQQRIASQPHLSPDEHEPSTPHQLFPSGAPDSPSLPYAHDSVQRAAVHNKAYRSEITRAPSSSVGNGTTSSDIQTADQQAAYHLKMEVHPQLQRYGSTTYTPPRERLSAWRRAQLMLDSGLSFPDMVRHEFEMTYQGAEISAVTVMVDESRLAPLMAQYRRAERRLTDLLDQYASLIAQGKQVKRMKIRVMGGMYGQWGDLHYGQRPMHVDALRFWTTWLSELFRRIKAEQMAAAGRYLPTAFVTFRSRWHQVVASTTLHDHDVTVWQISPAPEPSDVLWGNLGMREWERSSKATTFSVIYVLIIFLYVFPVSAVQALLQVDKMAKLPVLKYIVQLPVIRSILAGILPGLAIRILILVMPYILMALLKRAGARSWSEVDFKVTTLYFVFQVVTVFLSSFIAGTLLNQLPQFIEQPTSILTILGTGAPQAASFFILYVLFSALVMRPFLLLRLFWLAVYWVQYGLAATSRARRRLWEEQLVNFGPHVAHHSIALLLGLVFCIINPVIAPVCLLYFSLVGVMERYQWLYVWRRSYESGGRMWPQVFVQTMTSLYIFQIVMLGLLSIKKFKFAPIVLLALIASIWMHLCVNRLFSRPWRVLSLRDAADLDCQDMGGGGEAASLSASFRSHQTSTLLTSNGSHYISPAFRITESQHGRVLQEVADMERRLQRASALDPRVVASEWQAEHGDASDTESDQYEQEAAATAAMSLQNSLRHQQIV